MKKRSVVLFICLTNLVFAGNTPYEREMAHLESHLAPAKAISASLESCKRGEDPMKMISKSDQFNFLGNLVGKVTDEIIKMSDTNALASMDLNDAQIVSLASAFQIAFASLDSLAIRAEREEEVCLDLVAAAVNK